jgi:Flp pilus assembly pilin Flp
MKQLVLISLFFTFFTYSQTQIGSDIDGEAAGDRSGTSVSLSLDGNTLAIGASGNDGINGINSGHVRVYKNISGDWTQIGDDIDGEALDDFSGTSVSLSSDGSILAIGAFFNDGNGSSSGHVRVYENISDVWTQIGNDINGEGTNDSSGCSVSLSSDGNILAIGARGNSDNGTDSGHVRIYKNVSGTWTQVGDDIDGEAAGDRSGESVSLSSDGSIVAIGAHRNDGNGSNSGHVRVYENISGVWTQIGDDIDGEAEYDDSGLSVSLSSDGSIVAIGAENNSGSGDYSGHVRVYQYINSVWTQIGLDIDGESANDYSGSSVSLSSDGSIVAIGAVYNTGINGVSSGHVRVYQNISNVWTQIGSDIDGEAVNDRSGISVSISSDGNTLAIGASGNDGVNGIDSGHVRVYDLSASLSTESFHANYFSMYPNPSQNRVNLKLLHNQKLKQINIYTVLGKYLYSEKSLSIDISHLSAGIYVLEVETNQGKSAKRLIKK